MSTILWCVGAYAVGTVIGYIVYSLVKSCSRTESDSDRAERYSRSRKD